MIDSEDFIRQEGIYIKDGKLWKVLSYCPEPSIEMVCMASGERRSFGVSGITNNSFERLNELKYNHKTCEVEKVNGNS